MIYCRTHFFELQEIGENSLLPRIVILEKATTCTLGLVDPTSARVTSQYYLCSTYYFTLLLDT